MRTWQRLMLYFGGLALVWGLLVLFGYASSFRMLCPTCFGMVQIAPNVYAENDLSPAKVQSLLHSVGGARARVRGFFGELQSDPKIIACHTSECYRQFGGNSEKGVGYGIFSLRLSPRGLSQTYIAHELTHIEFHDRVGLLRIWLDVPQWFDEGLATYVSGDPRYGEQAWLRATENGRHVPSVHQLNTLRAWIHAVARGVPAYSSARHKVQNWLGCGGGGAVLTLVKEMRQGKLFRHAYADVHRRVACVQTET